MKKYPFTTNGVHQWQTELYAQPDTALAAEAAAVSADLAGWLPDRFSLTPEQVNYVNAIDRGLRDVWSAELAYAINHRVPVVLDKPETPPTGSARGTKLVLSEAEWEWLESQTRKEEGAGQLTFTISY